MPNAISNANAINRYTGIDEPHNEYPNNFESETSNGDPTILEPNSNETGPMMRFPARRNIQFNNTNLNQNYTITPALNSHGLPPIKAVISDPAVIVQMLIDKQAMLFNILEKLNNHSLQIITTGDYNKKGRQIFKIIHEQTRSSKDRFVKFNRSMIKTSETDPAPYNMTDIDIEVFSYSVEEGSNNVDQRKYLFNSNTNRGRLIAFKFKNTHDYIGIADYLDPDFRSLLKTDEELNEFKNMIDLAEVFLDMKADAKADRDRGIIKAIIAGSLATAFGAGLAVLSIIAGLIPLILASSVASALIISAFKVSTDISEIVSERVNYYTKYRHPGTSVANSMTGGYRHKTRKSVRKIRSKSRRYRKSRRF